MTPAPLFLEDLAIGQVFRAGPLTVAAEEIIAFARQYDNQPFHTDPVAAAAHPVFQGLAASGWHTAALMMSMVTEALGHLGWGVIGGGGELSWARPVRPGDALRLEIEVKEVAPSRSRPDRGSVLVENRLINQHGEVVTRFTPRLVVPTRPPEEPA